MNYFDQDKFKSLVRALQQMVRCPQCGGVFSENDVELVAGIGQSYFVKMSCGNCGINLMASMMSIEKAKSAQQPLFTQNNQVDLRQRGVSNSANISADDLIGLHEYLRDFQGDFKAVFSK